MKPNKIQQISTAQLEAILAPHMIHGLVSTRYNRGIDAFEYRLPNHALLAVSVGSHHFTDLQRVRLVAV